MLYIQEKWLIYTRETPYVVDTFRKLLMHIRETPYVVHSKENDSSILGKYILMCIQWLGSCIFWKRPMLCM